MVEEFEPDVFRQLIEYIHTATVTLQPRTLLGEFTQLFLKVGNWSFPGWLFLPCSDWFFILSNFNHGLKSVWWGKICKCIHMYDWEPG